MYINKNLKHIVQLMVINSSISRVLLLGYIILMPLNLGAQTVAPQWMHKLPKANPANKTYTFVRTSADAFNLDMGRSKCFQLLAIDQSLLNTLTISYSSKDFISATTETRSGKFNEKLDQKTFEVITTEGKPIQVRARVVDEFFSSKKEMMTTLYQVAVTPDAVLDDVRITTSYVSDPATWGLSLIPGAAQMYKGSYWKGGFIMGGTAALVAGVLVAENLRNVNKGKIEQTHSADVKKQYNDRVNTCATVRNICLGGLAAVYIYNIVDAFVAPGARRVIVTPTTDGVGVAYNF